MIFFFNFLRTFFLLPTKFDKTSKRLDKLIDQQNKELFIPRGLQILPPKRSGYRNIQIVIYKIPPHPKSLKNSQDQNQQPTPQVISAGSPTRRSKSVKTEDDLKNSNQDIGTMV